MRERVETELSCSICRPECATSAHNRDPQIVRYRDRMGSSDQSGRHRTAQGERERLLQIQKVAKMGRGNRRAKKQHSEPLERERARDHPTTQRMHIAFGTRDDDRRTMNAFGSGAESYQQILDRSARCVLVRDAEIACGPTTAQLGLDRAEHTHDDLIERHSEVKELDRQSIREGDVAVHERSQHRYTLIISGWMVGCATHRRRLRSPSRPEPRLCLEVERVEVETLVYCGYAVSTI